MKVYVTAPPVGGEANRAVCELLAKVVGIPKSRVSVAAGQSSRDKRIVFEGVSESDALDRICAAASQKPLPGT